MYGKPLLRNCYECSNCKIIVIFTKLVEKPNSFDVEYKWYWGKDKEKVVEQYRKFERK